MSAIIIVEGLDRCGKSTIIEHIRKNVIKKSQIVTMHSSSPPKGVTDPMSWAYSHYVNLLTHSQVMAKGGTVVLHDRSYIGEYVYGPMYRKTDSSWIFNDTERASLESLFDLDKMYLILCTDTIENRLLRDDGLSQTIDEEKMSCEYKNFIEAFAFSGIKNKMHLHSRSIEEMKSMTNEFLENINVE